MAVNSDIDSRLFLKSNCYSFLTSSEFAFATNHEAYNPKRCCQSKSSQVYDDDILDATVL